jgi:hypothetical protein
LSTLIALVVASQAHASTLALDPQNRLHVGASYVPGPAPVGLSVGFDSRLTRVLAIDFGGFASPVALPEGLGQLADGEEAELPDSAHLRHGIYVTPGLRIPHPQPRTWAWEVFVRGGAGVAWTADVSPDVAPTDDLRYAVLPDLAGIAGADALVRFGRFGVRASGKAWMVDAIQTTPAETFFIARSQWGLEGLVQW